MADPVDLTELDVISRWSLAVRSATADRAELIAALESDLAYLRGGRQAAAAPRKRPATPDKAATAKKAAPRKRP